MSTDERRIRLRAKQYILSSDKDTHFTESIAENAVEKENLEGLASNKITITKIAIQAMENLDFEVMFFGKNTFENTDLDVDSFQAFERLDIPTYGIRIGAANQYYLDISGLAIDYEDEDAAKEWLGYVPTLHVALRCRSAAGKSAGAAGQVKLTFTYIPRV